MQMKFVLMKKEKLSEMALIRFGIFQSQFEPNTGKLNKCLNGLANLNHWINELLSTYACSDCVCKKVSKLFISLK